MSNTQTHDHVDHYHTWLLSSHDTVVLQIDVDIGSSAVARSVIGLVLGYVTSLIVDLAILIEVRLGSHR